MDMLVPSMLRVDHDAKQTASNIINSAAITNGQAIVL